MTVRDAGLLCVLAQNTREIRTADLALPLKGTAAVLHSRFLGVLHRPFGPALNAIRLLNCFRRHNVASSFSTSSSAVPQDGAALLSRTNGYYNILWPATYHDMHLARPVASAAPLDRLGPSRYDKTKMLLKAALTCAAKSWWVARTSASPFPSVWLRVMPSQSNNRPRVSL